MRAAATAQDRGAGSYRPVEAVLRGLDVMRVVSRAGPCSVGMIHQETGIDKATIVRMLETLIHAGYVAKGPDSRAYSVTMRVRELSSGSAGHEKAAEICAPILNRLRQTCGWPSDFAIRDDDTMIVVRTSREGGPFHFNRNPGFRAPFLKTSIGLAYLAFCTQAENLDIQSRIGPEPGRPPTRASIERRLARIRMDGYAVMEKGYSLREYKGRISAIAVPVLHGGRIHGALNLMFEPDTLSLAAAVRAHFGPLREAAAEIGDTLAATRN